MNTENETNQEQEFYQGHYYEELVAAPLEEENTIKQFAVGDHIKVFGNIYAGRDGLAAKHQAKGTICKVLNVVNQFDQFSGEEILAYVVQPQASFVRKFKVPMKFTVRHADAAARR